MNETHDGSRKEIWRRLGAGAAALMSVVALQAGDAWAGDYNGDGYDDLVVGATGDSIGPDDARAGVAYVFRGKSTGPTAEQLIDHTEMTMGADDDGFGTAFASGDFDGDGYEDLAVGIPGREVDISVDAGLVMVFRGSSDGLLAQGPLWQSGAGYNEPGDRFGAAMVSGDFDGDGYDDLAVGAPGKSLGDGRSGVVVLFRGSANGLVVSRYVDQAGMGDNSDGDAFGSSLAAGDFDADGYADLCVGAPGESIGNGPRSGVVFCFLGSANDLAADRYLHQVGMGTNEKGDEFGQTVAAGDFNGDGYADLAVGAPGEALGNSKSGAVFLFLGSASGLNTHRYLDQAGMGGNSPGDLFGSALAAEDFNGDGYADLAVGAPGESIGNGPTSGVAFIFRGTANGLKALYYVSQASLDANEEGDAFGSALASGDYDGDGYADLAIGAPGERIGTGPKSGAVFLFRGSASGPTQDRLLDQTDLGMNEAGDAFGRALSGR